MTDLRHLLESLRRGERPPLSVYDVELLLGWLTGSAARDGAEGADLPSPGHDPVLLQMVLYRLDDVLFDSGELRPAAAGLDTSEPAMRRRIRFRRLASAFHPDRFPDLADWLTQRSQAVHRAYAGFKQDPDAPFVVPNPAPPRPARHPASREQEMRRTSPRVRKRRIRAFANRLRARVGNDRYLAHKLIGGLALLALLPVLNMVLVPAKDTQEPPYGSQFPVGAREEEKPGSDFRVPVSGERRDGGTVDAGESSVGAGSGRDDSVGAVSGRDRSASETTPTKRDSSGQDAPPTTNQPANRLTSQPSTGVGAGLADDDWEPGSRVAANQGETADPDAPARQPETGKPEPSPRATDPEITPLLAAARHAMNPNGEIATAAALQTVDEQLAAMGLENDTERLYRRIGGEESVDGGREEKSVSGFRVPVSGEKREGATQGSGEESTGVDSSGDESAQDAPPTTSQPANEPTSEVATGVGAASSRDDGVPEPRNAAVPIEAAETGRPARKPETRNPKPAPSAQDAPPTASRTAGPAPSKDTGAGPAGDDPAAGAGEDPAGAASSRDDRGPETRNAAVPIEAAETGRPARKSETGNSEPAPSAQDAPPRASRTADPAPSARTDSDLFLGLPATHPAGEALERLHSALVAGNIPGIAGSFAPDARMASLQGRDEIAAHFRAGFDSADSRQVQLNVLRLDREGDGWRVEADLDVTVGRDNSSRTLVAGRVGFLLVERGDRLLIARMDL